MTLTMGRHKVVAVHEDVLPRHADATAPKGRASAAVAAKKPEHDGSVSIKEIERQTGREVKYPEARKILLANGVTEKHATVNVGGQDIDAFYLEAGNTHRTTVILIHGGGDCTSMNWRYQIPALAESFHVVALDLVGYGDTVKPEGHEATLSYQEDFVLKSMDAIGIDRANLVGSSMGGGIVAGIATNYPSRVDKVFLISPHNVSDTELSTPIKYARRLAQYLPLSIDKKIMATERIKSAVGTFSNAFWDYIRGKDFEKKYDISKLKMPAFFVHGSEDHILVRKHAVPEDEYAELVPGVFGKYTEHESGNVYLEIKDAHHGPQYEHPEFINSKIAEFFKAEGEESRKRGLFDLLRHPFRRPD